MGATSLVKVTCLTGLSAAVLVTAWTTTIPSVAIAA